MSAFRIAPQLQFSGLDFLEGTPPTVRVRFKITSSLGQFDLTIQEQGADLHAAVEKARSKVLQFAEGLVRAASQPVQLG